jgi:hypothetical protein
MLWLPRQRCVVGGGRNGCYGVAGSGRGGCDGFASGGHVCGVCDVNLDHGIASGIRAIDGGRINNVHTGGNAAININVSVLIVTFVDEGLRGNAGFALL